MKIDYVYLNNDSRPMYHTMSDETGRYSTANHKEAKGVAVIMTSKRSPLVPGSSLYETSFNKDGDTSGCFPPFLENFPRNQAWIAIVKRGGCTFNDKVKNALKLNASGIIVYDNKDREQLQTMKGKIRILVEKASNIVIIVFKHS